MKQSIFLVGLLLLATSLSFPQGNIPQADIMELMRQAEEYAKNGQTADAMHLYRQLAEQGYAPAQSLLGDMYLNEKDYTQAVYWYKKAAEQADAQAQYNLGNSYEYGDGVEQDYTQAVYWYQKAAKERSPTHLHFMKLILDNDFYPKPVNTYQELLKAEN